MGWFPAIGAVGELLGGAGGLAGAFGLGGSDDAAQAAKKQAKIAETSLEASLAPRVDAYGNVISYGGPKIGWSTKLSPISQQLLDASTAEEYRRNTADMALRRSGMLANALRRGQEGAIADTLLRRYRADPGYNRDNVTNALIEQAARGVTRGYDDQSNQVLRQFARSGTNADNYLAQSAVGRGRALSDAILNAQVQGPQQYENLEQARIARETNPYNMFAGRASNIDDTAFAPSPIASNLQSGMQAQANTVPYSAMIAASGQGARAQYPGGMNWGTVGTGLDALLQSGKRLYDALWDSPADTNRGLGNSSVAGTNRTMFDGAN